MTFPFYIKKDNFYFSTVNNLYIKGVFTVIQTQIIMYGNFVDLCYNYLERHVNSDFKMVVCNFFALIFLMLLCDFCSLFPTLLSELGAVFCLFLHVQIVLLGIYISTSFSCSCFIQILGWLFGKVKCIFLLYNE